MPIKISKLIMWRKELKHNLTKGEKEQTERETCLKNRTEKDLTKGKNELEREYMRTYEIGENKEKER
jgi:hypothetical protein